MKAETHDRCNAEVSLVEETLTGSHGETLWSTDLTECLSPLQF